ncbi:Glycosyl transferases group 1 [Bremerella volcania]|uniref:Glycosyl transferases group 1 n=1 Tax=Bremerella volcania TaxID=2527984 RepID=A0A518CCC8_9BACT|nr:glycosyltransferase [Bremerella volcania]QDU76877.1 Glycosyl transferases group 1 [Bremerella volcania]
MRVFLMGYPGDLGGACTEAWHTVKLWRRFDADVHLIATWGTDAKWRSRVDALGCTTHTATPETLDQVPGLAGATVVSFCNAAFLANAKRLRELGCRLAWVNCMTWLFDAERKFYRESGPFDAFVFQSEFQRSMLEPELTKLGYTPGLGNLIRGAFDFEEWEFNPRPHADGEAIVVGRAARPDLDKWSSNTWPIYNRIQYRNKRALMLGMDERTHQKLGAPPEWADCLKPMALPAHDYFRQLHCTLPVNGGARENWPRVGLEAMAAGVAVVAQNDWGWREMIEHGVTGFLGSCDEELAHHTAVLAYDETLRMRIINAARERLVNELASPNVLWAGWKRLFEAINTERRAAA